jgi:hypothetical protein
MAVARGQAATKNQLIELVVLALGASQMKDVGLGALRGVLGSDPRFAVLDGAADLQPVWELLESQPDFQKGAAVSALCWVKAQEPRLGISLKLPAALEEIPAPERITHASYCRPKREDVDRVIQGLEAPRKPSALPASPTAPMVRPATNKRRQMVGIIAGVVAAASLAFVGVFVAKNVEGKPDFKNVDAAEFAGDLPVTAAKVWGSEVRVSLVDGGWMKLPEDRRRRQMEQALERLQARPGPRITTLIVEDDARRPRASAQLAARGGKSQVKFYP